MVLTNNNENLPPTMNKTIRVFISCSISTGKFQTKTLAQLHRKFGVNCATTCVLAHQTGK